MKFQVYPDRSGRYRWRFKAENGRIIATSHQSFANKWNAERATRKVWRNMRKRITTVIVDEYGVEHEV